MTIGRHADPNGVLVTRPEPGDVATAARLSRMAFAPVLAPCLSVRPCPAQLPAPSRLQAVVVASGNAVAGVPAAFHVLPLLAVGDATAALARQAGFTLVLSAGADAVALAALAARRCDPGGAPLLLATGARQGAALAADLRQRGFRVLRRIVYMACPVTALPPAALQAVRDRTLRAALFFSAETATAFVRAVPPDLLPAIADIEALAISQRVGHVLRPLPWRRVRVAVRPTQDDLLALLHE